VFAPTGGGALTFHPLDELTTLDVEEVLATIEPLVARRLRRRGLAGDADDAMTGWADDAPAFAELAAASIRHPPCHRRYRLARQEKCLRRRDAAQEVHGIEDEIGRAIPPPLP